MTNQIQIRSLSETSHETLLRASNEAFSDYQVDVTMTLEQLVRQLHRNSVSLEHSAGAFADGTLVGFWLNGLREIDGVRTAYDSGTAICKPFRGQGISSRLSQLSTRLLVDDGVQAQVLEVLTENHKAHAIYRKDGFQEIRMLRCLKTAAPTFPDLPLPSGVRIERGTFDPAVAPQLAAPEYRPSWQNATESMANIHEDVLAVTARQGQQVLASGLAIPREGRIVQLGCLPEWWESSVPSVVLRHLCEASEEDEIGIINVGQDATRTLGLLERHGFELFVEQYEMIKGLTGT